MAKSYEDIASDLNEKLRRSGKPVVTLTWPTFYDVCERDRLKDAALAGIQEHASGSFQLIISYGRNAVVVCHDRNFQPAP
jgi:hypothetical protein